MSGIYGIISNKRSCVEAVRILPNLDAKFVVESSYSDNQLHIKHFGYHWAKPKIGQSRSGKVTFCYIGHIHEPRIGNIGRQENQSLASYLAEVFEQKNNTIWPFLNGSWVAVVWSQATRTLFLATDRLGTIALYYAEQGAGFSFSTSKLALTKYGLNLNKLAAEALVEFLMMGYAQDDRTYIDGIKVLNNASVLMRRNERTTIENYWVPDLSADDKWQGLKRQQIKLIVFWIRP